MDIVKGSIVKAKAGRDKERFFVVMEIEGNYAFICDGKHRPIQRQKKKKLIHLSPTLKIVDTQLQTNREVKKVLREFKGL